MRFQFSICAFPFQDLETFDLEDFKYNSVNITAFRIVDVENAKVRESLDVMEKFQPIGNAILNRSGVIQVKLCLFVRFRARVAYNFFSFFFDFPKGRTRPDVWFSLRFRQGTCGNGFRSLNKTCQFIVWLGATLGWWIVFV